MDIDKNDIQILAKRIPKILIESSFTLLKRNPKASFAWFLIPFSYLFFPTILWFLIYTIPFIVLIAAISIKTYISVKKGRDAKKHEEAKDGKSPRKVQSAEDASNENKKYNAKHARSVRRRKSKITFIESMQEKEAICSTNFTHELIDKKALIEEIPKDIPVVEANGVNDYVESSPSDVSLDFQSRFNLSMSSQRFGCLNREGISSDNTGGKGDETREEARTANQGAEDDHKNLADLGLSEIQRNKRLENLIARRRAQKILSLPLRRTMMNLLDNDSPGQNMYPIVIQRSSPLSPRTCQFIPGPVSAPPVSNMRNPFDLPYEPHEEKPNLTSDGFHQEFLGTPPKDMMLCRHESFRLGGTLPGDLRHNLHKTPLHHNHGINKEILETQEKTECQSGGSLSEASGHVNVGERDKEMKVEQEQSQEVECDDKDENTEQSIQEQDSTQGPDLDSVSHEDLPNEVKTKSVIVEGYNGRLSFSSSSEESEPIGRLDKEKILKFLRSPPPRKINIQNGGGRSDDHLFTYGLSKAQNTKRPESFYYPDRTDLHTRSDSIASDMQVEVSEFSSPPHLSDTNMSSPDEVRSLSDGKFETEISDSEDMWISSSRLSGVDENESRSRAISEIGEKDITGVGSKIPVERVIAQDSSNPHSNIVSDSNITGDSDVNNEHIIHEQPNTSCPNSSHDMKPKVLQSHKEKQLTGTSLTDLFCDSDLGNPQVPSLPPSTPAQELNINLSSSNLQAHNIDNVTYFKTTGIEYRKTYSHESTGESSQHGNTSGSMLDIDDIQDLQHSGQVNLITNQEVDNNISYERGGGDLQVPGKVQSEEHHRPARVNYSTSESSQSGFTREIEEMSEEMPPQMEMPHFIPTEGNYILEYTPDTDDEPPSIAIVTPEPNQFVIQPNEVLSVPEILTEQDHPALSTSSSPKSVLNPRFSGSQGYISNISDDIQMENQHSGGESSGSNSSSLPSQTAAPSAEDLTTFQSHERITERIQVTDQLNPSTSPSSELENG